MERAPSGFIVYEGPSELDGSPIVAIVTLESSNRKTGPMAQLWILAADVDPLESIRQDNNQGVCGDCPLQGTYDAIGQRMVNRVCYVNLGQAPLAIWNAYRRGIYGRYSHELHAPHLRARQVRLGAYGDPAALPIELVEYFAAVGSGWTGYTHQAFSLDADRATRLASVCMVSCHNLAQYREAARSGWRAFLAVSPGQSGPADAIRCPYETNLTTCHVCQLCQGTAKQARSIWIEAHGAVGKNLSKITSEV